MDEASPPTPLVENVDYYLDELGRFVFTEEYHRKRGYCCKNGCKHCPYGDPENKAGKTGDGDP